MEGVLRVRMRLGKDGGAKRNSRPISRIYRVPGKMGSEEGAWARSVRSLLFPKVSCEMFAMISVRCWAVGRVGGIII